MFNWKSLEHLLTNQVFLSSFPFLAYGQLSKILFKKINKNKNYNFQIVTMVKYLLEH